MFKKTVSGIMLALLLIGLFSLTVNIKPAKSTWTGTVYIRADGNVDPPDAPIITLDNITYTLIDNIVTSGNGIVIERSNIIVDGAGYTIHGPGTSRYYTGVYIHFLSNITVKNLMVENFYNGIYICSSSDNRIIGNVITGNYRGIHLYSSSNNNIAGNNIISNGYLGVFLVDSLNNNIVENTLANQDVSITLQASSHNFIARNTISANLDGIDILGSDLNIICENNVTNVLGTSSYGIYVLNSYGNAIYHNNFINNRCSAVDAESNLWDDGYPSGGNYWDDYTGVDEKSGPNQDQPGSDGIGDTPYVIDSDSKDRYPLMKPFFHAIHNVAIVNAKPYKTIVGHGLSLNINVASSNKGHFTETFNITLYANTTEIGTIEITLPSGNSATITFTWNTSGFAKGNYTIWAYAWPVSGETDTADNILIDGWVVVAMVGDMNYDGKVDIKDVAMVSRAFGSLPGHPIWNPNLDINNDQVIDIKDVAIVSRQYGKIDP